MHCVPEGNTYEGMHGEAAFPLTNQTFVSHANSHHFLAALVNSPCKASTIGGQSGRMPFERHSCRKAPGSKDYGLFSPCFGNLHAHEVNETSLPCQAQGDVAQGDRLFTHT